MLKISLLALLLTFSPIGQTKAVDIITNSTSKNEFLSKSQLRLIFEGKKIRWENGIPVRIFILPPDHIATKSFAWEILGLAPEAWKDIKTAAISNSQRNKFYEVATELDMIRYISSTNGSIGYINNKFMVNKNGNIKIVIISN